MAKIRTALIQARKAKGWSQREVAEFLGVKGNTYNGWERGTRNPDLEMAGRIAKLFGMTVEEIFFGKVGARREQIGGPPRAAEGG